MLVDREEIWPGLVEERSRVERAAGRERRRIDEQLKDAYERRSDLQHDYVNTAARGIHAATLGTIGAVPLLLQEVSLHITRHHR